ncbi:MAG: DUF3303 family protein [Cyanobacteria bacterium P01_C01_bin.38]
MLFMVVEKFKDDATRQIYYRSQKEGRMLPEGLKYIDSWIDVNLNRCFQLMECDDLLLIQEWILQWQDLAKFEVIPVVPSKDTSEMVLNDLNNHEPF